MHADRPDEGTPPRGVTLFADLDAELHAGSQHTPGKPRAVDDVVRRLIPQRERSREALRDAAGAVPGHPASLPQTALLA